MASRRLNKHDRENIVESGVKYTFGDQRIALKEAGDQLILAVRARMYPKSVLGIIDTLPASFLSQRNTVNVYIKNSDGTGSTETVEVVGSKAIFFAANDGRYNYPNIAVFRDEKGDAELIEAVEEYNRTSDELSANERKFKKMAEAILGRYTTANKLIEAWPDAKLFIPKSCFEEVAKEYLPAETMQTLEGMVALAKARRAGLLDTPRGS